MSLYNKRGMVTIAACFFAFVMGLPMCFESGFFLFQLMDQRTGFFNEIIALFLPFNQNETYTFMCMGRAGRFGQH